MKKESDFKARELMPRGPINAIDVNSAKLVSTGVNMAIGLSKGMNKVRGNVSLAGKFIGDVTRLAINTVRADHEARQRRREHLEQYTGPDAPNALLVMGKFEEPQKDHLALAEDLAAQLIDNSIIRRDMAVTVMGILPSNGFKESPLVDETISAMHEALVDIHHLKPSEYAIPGSDDATIVLPVVPTTGRDMHNTTEAPDFLDNTLTRIEHHVGEAGDQQTAIILITDREYPLPPSLGVPEENISGGHDIYSLTNVLDNPAHALLWHEQVAHAA
jgi:hypothetical protein